MNTIIWSNNAKTEYAELLQRVYDRSVDEALELNEKMEALQDRLEIFKNLCPPHPEIPSLRRCVVTQHISIVYDIKDTEITIFSVFDNRSGHLLNT